MLDAVDAAAASAWLAEERQRVLDGPTMKPERTRFSEFVARFVERRVALGELASAKTRDRWRDVLENHLIPAFGDFFLDALSKIDIENWKAAQAVADVPLTKWQKKRVEDAKANGEPIQKREGRRYSPNTINGWLRVLRVVTVAATEELGLSRDPMTGVKDIDASTHRTYTDESPNSLKPEDVPRFLIAVNALFPQRAAMVTLGLVTGLRPSSMRPLRRKGAAPDVKWDENLILIRRSHTRRAEVMEKTKTAKDQRIALPAAMVEVLRRHVAEFCKPGTKEGECELLFPSAKGGFLSASVLDDVFERVGEEIGLTYRVTPRAMRRTFKDLSRAAGLQKIVEGSISGHVTEAMDKRYSTVRPEEQREGLERVVLLALPAPVGAPPSQPANPKAAPKTRDEAPENALPVAKSGEESGEAAENDNGQSEGISELAVACGDRSGRGWVRTSDFHRVRMALSH